MRTFTASETVYFHPEHFAREKKLLDAVALPHTDRKFDASELAEAILAAALLRAERAGALRLEQATASRLLGLRKVAVVEASAGPKADASPPATIEARLRQLVASRPLEVERLVHALLEDDSTYPELLVLGAVQRGLVDAGLLESTQTKRLGIFTVEGVRVPEATRALISASTSDGVRAELDSWKAARPAEWEILRKAIAKGIASRKEASDGPD